MTQQQYDKYLDAGGQIGDVIVLMTDDIPNKQQAGEIFAESFEAVQAARSIGSDVSQRDAQLAITEGVLHRLNVASVTDS